MKVKELKELSVSRSLSKKASLPLDKAALVSVEKLFPSDEKAIR
jgi:hypothetical protein